MPHAHLALVLLSFSSGSLASQQTIHVPADQPTIQAGVAVASDGDTVVVAQGWYQERVDFLGKAITVKSAAGPEVTVITAEGLLFGFPGGPEFSQERVVRFVSGEGEDSVLEGFTITGQAKAGFFSGGVYADWSTTPVTVRNCIIEDNEGHYGGGVYGGVHLVGCTIRNNGGYEPGTSGGGVYGGAVLQDCIIENNKGGGVYGSPTMINCLVKGNQAMEQDGGGLYATGACTVVDCQFIGNGAGGDGRTGGGVFGPAKLYGCVFFGNNSSTYGCCDSASAIDGAQIVQSCTVVNNPIPTASGPVEAGAVANVGLIIDSIVRDNSGPPFPPSFTSSVKYSNIEGGYPGTGNIDAEPLFHDATVGDFRLLPDSPCIDTGDPLSEKDVDGTVADMGAIPFDHFPVCQPGQATLSATAPFDHVGKSLAASGPYVIAGVPDVDGLGFESGAVSLLYRDGEGWVELPQIVASDEAAGALFGHSVALHEDVALIGARGASAEAGAAYVFRQQPDGTWAEEAKLEALDALPGDWLGSRVAVEGGVAAASALHADAPGTDSGAVYVFRDSGSGWAQEQKLVGLDSAAGDQFGKGLAMSGGRILAGAYADDDAGQDSGSAYVFRDDGGFWAQEAKLTASDAAASALFGNEVALDGEVAVVAARSANGVGAVYVFRRSGTSWSQEAKLVASTPLANAEFGSAVALVGDRILVGARLDDSAANEAGAAYLFEFDGSTWTETAKYTLPSAAPGDHLGSAVALSGSYAMVGAEWADDPALDSGELWAFPLPGTCQPQITSVQPTSAQFPEGVTAEGLFLGQTQSVLVDGVPASLIGVSDFTVTYQPQPSAPGHVALEATGLDGTAVSDQQMYPSLEASTTGIGGTVDVLLDNGEPGLYVLAFATNVFPAPLPIASPPTWYGVLLDITGPVFTPSIGAFASADPVSISLPVPNNPTLSGLTLHFQAWCQQGFFGPEVTNSFTNERAVTL